MLRHLLRLVKEICKLWLRIQSVSQHSEYNVLEPEFTNLTLALRSARAFFTPQWSDISEVFGCFSPEPQDHASVHNEQARNRVMVLGYSSPKLISFLNENDMSHVVGQFHGQLGDDMETGILTPMSPQHIFNTKLECVDNLSKCSHMWNVILCLICGPWKLKCTHESSTFVFRLNLSQCVDDQNNFLIMLEGNLKCYHSHVLICGRL